MKKAVIGLLIMSGFAMAATRENVERYQPHMSVWTRMALNSQSPRVKFTKHGDLKPGYYVVRGHGTINAFVPHGK